MWSAAASVARRRFGFGCLQKSQEIQSAAVVGALQIRRLQMQQEFFTSLLISLPLAVPQRR